MVRFLLAAALCAAGLLAADGKGEVQRIRVHGKSLEGNLAGDSPDREVTVYLPPSYAKSPKRRYPVLYLLHGFTDSDEKWMGLKKHFVNVPESADRAVAAGAAKEMIVVMPNAFTKFQGSMYSVSPVTGDWETYVAQELVAYIDGHYRTMARPESRGLAGHSMGGYGTVRLAMKRPGVFSSIYAMSPCCLLPSTLARGADKVEAVKSFEDFEKADFGTKAVLAGSAAWSPNPKNPPLYLDLLVKNGEPQPGVQARLAANAPVAMLDQYLGSFRGLKAVAMDIGDKDFLLGGAKELDRMLTERDVAHSFAIYEGNHVNKVSERIEGYVLPFFSWNLVF